MTGRTLGGDDTILASALDLASRGFRIFPLRPGDYRPAVKDWQKLATTDTAMVRRVWGSTAYNIGVCGGDGLLIVDIDRKNGKDGLASLNALGIELSGLVVQTPTGGFHGYYRGTDVSNAPGRVGVGIDIRSKGGYVVGPGSVLDERAKQDGGTKDPGVYRIVRDDPLIAVPPLIIQKLVAPTEKAADMAPLVQPDRPDAVDRAMSFLAKAPLAVEGENGDHLTFTVAAKLKDFGVSREMALDLMAGHWNHRCSPAWDHEDLKTKVGNAYEYGASPIGIAHPAADFAGVKLVEPPDGGLRPPGDWPVPKPLPSALPPVPPFDPVLLPDAFRDWVMDIAGLMQCPPDFVAVAAMVAAGSVIGRKVAIRPQGHTDWAEVGNLWGCVVGRPGVMKTPAMAAALAPIRRLDRRAADANRQAFAAHAAAKEQFHFAQGLKKKAASKGDGPPDLSFFEQREPPPPPARRYLVHDVTYEAVGIILSENPTGVMQFRDELVSMLTPLDREENAPARGFLLSAWTGNEDYSFDRITRDSIHISGCCLSLLGSTQPVRWTAYTRAAVRGGTSDDGLAQRFQMLVWPDVAQGWLDVDRAPNSEFRKRADDVFDRLDALNGIAAGAEVEVAGAVPFLRFAPDALLVFKGWRAQLEARVRSGDLHPALEAHLAKFRGLAAKLALICHLIDEGSGPVGLASLKRALAWCAYLEGHAGRAYAAATASGPTGARTILRKLAKGDLETPFTERQIQRAGWSNLSTREEVAEALELLEDLGYVRSEKTNTGGRPTILIHLNPKAAGHSPQ